MGSGTRYSARRNVGIIVLTCCTFLAAGCSRTQEIPSGRVELPQGCFVMGELRIYPEEGPLSEVCLEGFEIMRTEVTNRQFQAFVDATGYVTRAERGWRSDEAGGPGVDVPPASAVFVSPIETAGTQQSWWKLTEGASWTSPAGPNRANDWNLDAPVVHVTREDAAAYAAWLGGRLPTEAEWEYAARGGKPGELFGWPDAPSERVAERANTWNGVFPFRNTAEDGHIGVAKVGSYPPNGYGLYDMIGNVWEWTSSPYTPDHSEPSKVRAGEAGYDPKQPEIPVGAIRGGSYLCAQNYCFRFRPAARQAQDLAFGTSHIGFRVVWDLVER